MKIPLNDLRAQHIQLNSEFKSVFSSILEKSDFIGGEAIQTFESEFAAFCGAAACSAVSNGTDALMLALIACGLKRDDEVIVPAQSFIATIEPVVTLGARPRFVDIDPDLYTINPAKIAEAITPKTKGIVVVHLYGQLAPMDEIMSIAKAHGLWVIEDCAQAHGAKIDGRAAGTFGDMGVFSFYPGKNLGACGDAGAVISNDKKLIQIVHRMRNHGRAPGVKYEHGDIGYNCRMDTIQAAILSIKLPYLQAWNSRRQQIASKYSEALSGFLKTPAKVRPESHVYHIYAVEIENRDGFMEELKKRGIQTGVHYPIPMHLQPSVQAMFKDQTRPYPVAEKSANRVLSLPIFPEMTDEQIDYVIKNVTDILSTSKLRGASI